MRRCPADNDETMGRKYIKGPSCPSWFLKREVSNFCVFSSCSTWKSTELLLYPHHSGLNISLYSRQPTTYLLDQNKREAHPTTISNLERTLKTKPQESLTSQLHCLPLHPEAQSNVIVETVAALATCSARNLLTPQPGRTVFELSCGRTRSSSWLVSGLLLFIFISCSFSRCCAGLLCDTSLSSLSSKVPLRSDLKYHHHHHPHHQQQHHRSSNRNNGTFQPRGPHYALHGRGYQRQ